MVRVLVTKERFAGETRVAGTPDTVKLMGARGLEVSVEPGCGANAFIADADYAAAGAKLEGGPQAWKAADVVLKVRPPVQSTDFGGDELDALKPGALLIGLLAPWSARERVQRLAERKVSSLTMELVPRTSRAQKMDALSSQASVAGYKAVLRAASELPKYFPQLMTAAGTTRPARVVVLGAGVAGLQAIATARRLGATVEASDIRPAVKEEVESLGARFIDVPAGEEATEGAGGYAREVSADFLRRQREIVGERLANADVVITTALVPGKRAPTLVTKEIVARMRPGSVIVDLAAEQGGNCELSEAGRPVRANGVLILGEPNLPGSVPTAASLFYARNVAELLLHCVKDKALALDPLDEIVSAALLTHEGKITQPSIG
jgi:H+-translocating NAD(P) transhydrogenase subunit alpha